MILIADCGSTKTDWVLCDGDEIIARVKTQGLNPTHQESEEIFKILSAELTDEITSHNPQKIYFYGAGCAYDTANDRMRHALEKIFTTKEIHINSDLLAAARALCKHEEGIACILGTGSNSCLFDGEKIVDNTPSLGYILGDEGSGYSIGLSGIKAAIRAAEGSEEKTALTEECLSYFSIGNIYDLIDLYYDKKVSRKTDFRKKTLDKPARLAYNHPCADALV